MANQPLTEPTGLRGDYRLEPAQARARQGPRRVVTPGYRIAYKIQAPAPRRARPRRFRGQAVRPQGGSR